MKSISTTDLYRKYYIDIRFERAELFKAIEKKYGCMEVLYPGCSVHITPSFFFPHVVYVDKNPTAIKFFADVDAVSKHVARNKKYKQSSCFHFIAQDYLKAMPLRAENFDLLLSLYAGGVARTCKKYLRMGGILLANNHHHEAREAALDNEFRLVSVGKFGAGRYTWIEDNLDRLSVFKGKPANARGLIRQSNNGIEYTENEEYYIFRRRFVAE
jgi:hypothetical protein